MTKNNKTAELDMERYYRQQIRPQLERAPWILRVTEHKGKPVPVFIVKERFSESPPNGEQKRNNKAPGRGILKDRGLLYGQPQRRCLPVIRTIVAGICDDAGIPLDLQRFIANGSITFRGNLPLDHEAGAKLSLIFKLRERLPDMDRVELIAWRVERFSREEAAYWLSRMTQYGDAANRWAQAGMRLMLGGQPGDRAVLQMLEKLRR